MSKSSELTRDSRLAWLTNPYRDCWSAQPFLTIYFTLYFVGLAVAVAIGLVKLVRLIGA